LAAILPLANPPNARRTAFGILRLVSSKDSKSSDGRIDGVIVMMVDRPVCVWIENARTENDRFLRGIDPDFFLRPVKRLQSHGFDTAERSSNAMGIRLGYWHAVETTLALIAATVQVPSLLPAWLDLYQTRDLDECVRRLRAAEPLPNRMGAERPSLSLFFEVMAQHFAMTEEARAEFSGPLTRVISAVADEWLDKQARSEYNALKHGFRVRMTGLQTISIGLESEPGKPAEPSSMTVIAGSEFGTKQMTFEKVDGRQLHRAAALRTMNWDPAILVARVEVMAAVVANTIACLRAESCQPGETATPRVLSADTLAVAGKRQTGVLGMNWQQAVSLASLEGLTEETLKRRYRMHG